MGYFNESEEVGLCLILKTIFLQKFPFFVRAHIHYSANVGYKAIDAL